MKFLFENRAQAGRFLADRLEMYAGHPRVVVLGLPRGGIPVAFEVARRLRAPLGAFFVRKLGVPGHRELAMGAIASGGIEFLNSSLINELGIPRHVIDEVVASETQELERLEQVCGGSRIPDLHERIVILVDDGLATGASMRAAVGAVREKQPERIVAAAPVGAVDTCRQLGREADEAICVETPEHFHGVGQWYEDFSQTTDEEVRELLEQGSGFRLFTPERTLQEDL